MKKGKRLLTGIFALIISIGVFTNPTVTKAADFTEEQLLQAYALQQQLYEAALMQQAAEAAAAQEQQNALLSPAGMPETYVDINLTTQTVVYYLNGVGVLVSPCVTGDVADGNSTPAGFYTIKTMVPGKRLIGPTWNVWVDYWMRFTDGAIGLHDASWRKSFGGDVYLTNGSHGCVNLPHDKAALLYGMVGIGTQVIVHY